MTDLPDPVLRDTLRLARRLGEDEPEPCENCDPERKCIFCKLERWEYEKGRS